MELKIDRNVPADRIEWERVARACPYATFFHTPQWSELLLTQHRCADRNAARKIFFSDGTSAILPLSSFRRIAWNILWSSPEGTYGGWISADQLTEDHAELLSGILQSYGTIAWRENPYDPLAREIEMPGAIADFTHVFDTEGVPIDAQLKAASKGHWAAVKQAGKFGVTIHTGKSIDEWRKHFDAYADSLRRWSRKGLQTGTRYSWKLFGAMAASPDIRLWVAEQNGRQLSSMIALYWNRHAVYWHAASFSDVFHLRPNDLLLDTFIRDAAEKGFRWVDLNPSGGLDKVAEFKDHIGAKRLEHRFLFKRTGLSAFVHALRKRAGRQ
jgi:hypothetical protein